MKHLFRRGILLGISLQFLLISQVTAQELVVGDFSLAGKERTERTEFAYTYRAVITDFLLDRDGNAIDADDDGQPGGTVTIDFDTLSLSVLPSRSVCGRVFASSLGDQGTNAPLEGVTITVDGMEDTLRAVTDDMSNFRLDSAPAGRFFVHIDGRTVTQARIDGKIVATSFPDRPYYPSSAKPGNLYLARKSTLVASISH